MDLTPIRRAGWVLKLGPKPKPRKYAKALELTFYANEPLAKQSDHFKPGIVNVAADQKLNGIDLHLCPKERYEVCSKDEHCEDCKVTGSYWLGKALHVKDPHHWIMTAALQHKYDLMLRKGYLKCRAIKLYLEDTI